MARELGAIPRLNIFALVSKWTKEARCKRVSQEAEHRWFDSILTQVMNLFILHEEPEIAAEYHCDKHVVKMIIEASQILSTVMHNKGLTGPYKPTHANHPCTLWAAESKLNFSWVLRYQRQLGVEFTRRYYKKHKCSELSFKFPDFIKFEQTPFVQCMPTKHKIENDPVTAYRNYYLAEKRYFAKWKLGNIPSWWL
jgi:hypothetical protein